VSKIKKTNIIYRIIALLILIFFLCEIFYFNYTNKKYINVTKNYIFNNNYFSKIKIKPKKAIYFIQLGIFAKDHEVDKIKAKMSLLGLNINSSKYILNGRFTTKVTIGPYNKVLLEETIKTLKNNNIKYYKIINE